MMAAGVHIKDGEFTKTVYTMIKEQKYNQAIVALSNISISIANTRSALSLLAYCHYNLQNYSEAAQYYERLSTSYPNVEEYKLYYAQALHKACIYDEAMKIASQIDNPKSQGKIIKLQAAIKYSEDDLPGAKSLVDKCPPGDPDTDINISCLLYKEGRFEEACEKFSEALKLAGYKPDLTYNVALCYYQMKQYAPALKYIAEIIEKGIRKHPELSVGMTTEGIEVRSVGNTITLHETALVEAFNLKAAIEYQLKNFDAAREALTDMPPRSEEELDAVTLHNQALMNMEAKPTEGFEKLQFLLQQSNYPPETFGNLLLLYCKYEYYDLAADILAENAHLTYKLLSAYMYDFLDALITQQTSPEEAFRKFDIIAAKHTEQLRKITKTVQEARQNHEEEKTRAAISDYEEALERYIPALMAQAKIYWDLENYEQVEKLFRKSVEFCNDHDVWKLNVAHVLFMQQNKFKEATGFYEPIVKKHYDNILMVSPVVLANLCVSYIMTSQNEEAEELMRKIEKEEEHLAYEDSEKKIYHLCIVNLVIGTLYCAKGNFEFGISRIVSSLEPLNKKLSTETWFYAKRCFLAMIETLCKHIITIKDSAIQESIQFFENCEIYGQEVKAQVDLPLGHALHPGKNTVTYEARQLKALLLESTQ
ncbi:Tetratricopeptide repeat protein 30A [Chamberlinius hualienensis]